MSYINAQRRTFPASAALNAYRLVTLVAGAVSECDAEDAPLGVVEYPVAAGDPVSIRLLNCSGTIELEASGAVAAGDLVVLAAGGTVVKDPGAGARTVIGRSLAAVTAGGVIEVVPWGYGRDLS
ncbi:MAG TPA: DUF2190 family protein [Solidesulfovibrio magneticus]|nr:DUF2190 family protein [Solidesulfovibrio magneticus]